MIFEKVETELLSCCIYCQKILNVSNIYSNESDFLCENCQEEKLRSLEREISEEKSGLAVLQKNLDEYNSEILEKDIISVQHQTLSLKDQLIKLDSQKGCLRKRQKLLSEMLELLFFLEQRLYSIQNSLYLENDLTSEKIDYLFSRLNLLNWHNYITMQPLRDAFLINPDNLMINGLRLYSADVNETNAACGMIALLLHYIQKKYI
jgi:hypothetical protein